MFKKSGGLEKFGQKIKKLMLSKNVGRISNRIMSYFLEN
jgi:hypothetical protein